MAALAATCIVPPLRSMNRRETRSPSSEDVKLDGGIQQVHAAAPAVTIGLKATLPRPHGRRGSSGQPVFLEQVLEQLVRHRPAIIAELFRKADLLNVERRHA